jgi:phosphatidylglycerophosphate synthase
VNPGKPPHPSIEQIKQVCQPPAVRDRKNSEHWVADVYLRDISPYLTSLLLRTPITANGVTYLMIATGALAGVALLIPGMPGASLALLLGQMQMLWDCSDGEIARWRGTSSPKGVFLDRVGHYVAESFIPVALGLRAAGFPDSGWLESAWPLVGALLALIIMFNKALNDMVHVSRAYNNMPKLEDKESVGVPSASGLRRVRSLARFVPFHRAYHSVELTILAFVAAVGDLFTSDLQITRILVALLAILGVFTIIGHFMAIMTSSKLK